MPIKCNDCGIIIARRDYLERHMEAYHDSTRDKKKIYFTCEYPNCGYTATSKVNFAAHRQVHERNVKPDIPCPEPNCVYHANTPTMMKRHMAFEHAAMVKVVAKPIEKRTKRVQRDRMRTVENAIARGNKGLIPELEAKLATTPNFTDWKRYLVDANGAGPSGVPHSDPDSPSSDPGSEHALSPVSVPICSNARALHHTATHSIQSNINTVKQEDEDIAMPEAPPIPCISHQLAAPHQIVHPRQMAPPHQLVRRQQAVAPQHPVQAPVIAPLRAVNPQFRAPFRRHLIQYAIYECPGGLMAQQFGTGPPISFHALPRPIRNPPRPLVAQPPAVRAERPPIPSIDTILAKYQRPERRAEDDVARAKLPTFSYVE